MTRLRVVLLVVGCCGALLARPAGPASGAVAKPSVTNLAAGAGERAVFVLPRRTTHVAVHWQGPRSAGVRVALSRDGRRYGPRRRVELDEVGAQRPNGRAYGTLIAAGGVRKVLVASNRVLRLSLVAIGARRSRGVRARTAGHIAQPPVISRAGWGANEALRFDRTGNEIWPPAFYPVQKLIVHHTATRNDDQDPAATIRSIYQYHAVTQGWGDIGYNFLVDEAGRVYEGRYSRAYADGEWPTGEDGGGNSVTAAHASGFNSGTVGVALLGTLTSREATEQARDSLERFLAWKADRHGLDPHGAALYTNPVNGTQKTFPNLAGHRDVNATECPGDAFYGTLPSLRTSVAELIDGTTETDTAPPTPPAGLVASAVDGRVDLDWADNAETDLAGYDVYRSASPGGVYTRLNPSRVTSSSYADTAVAAGTTYHYVVTATDDAGNESGFSAEASATIPAASITLDVRAYKVKGAQHADLAWHGATTANVDVERNGTVIATTANDGAHTDPIGKKGGGTYTYRVCDAGTSTCSGRVTVRF